MKRPSWRLAALALIFGSMFSVLTLRLWYLQVTEAAQFEEQAQRQQVRLVSSPAPRGEILDRNGRPLAGSRSSLSVVVDRQLVPEDRVDEVIQRLASLLGMAPVEVRAIFNEAKEGVLATLENDIEDGTALFIMEHAEDFPGVRVARVPVRTYPEGVAAAHIVGYIGRPSQADLSLPGVEAADVIGKFGVEKSYDIWLRGTPGLTKFGVDAGGRILSVNGEQPPQPGGTVVTTIDLDTQKVLEDALWEGLTLSRAEGRPAVRASGVVMDPLDGSVVAMASIPSFDPSIFIGGLTQTEWENLQANGALNNFAIQGNYAPASAFKVVAYTMALEEGIYPQQDPERPPLASPEDNYFDTGRLEFQFFDGSPNVYNDWAPAGHGSVNLHRALEASCDLYFWELALRVWRGRGSQYDEGLIQDWARKLGFGSVTGIDLPFEQKGLVPDRAWFEKTQRESPGRVRAEGAWSGGDVMNIVIGQGAVTSTPLQVANAYAAVVNGGTLWEPRVVDRVLDRAGEAIFENPPKQLADLALEPRTSEYFLDDLRLVVNGPSGTARSAFLNFGPRVNEVGGKTGTAEVVKGAEGEPDIDTAWFVGVAPIGNPRYVVAIVVERGGSGGQIAAPVGAKVLAALLGEAPVEVLPGEDSD